MKKIFLSIFALTAIFAVSCNKELSKEDLAPVLSKGTIYKIKASVDDQTKTAYADGKTFRWVAGDKIAVAISNPDGEVDFAEFSTSESGPVAEFSGHVLVVFISVFVYIKFPAYAAVVGAFAACAVEAVVEIGYA